MQTSMCYNGHMDKTILIAGKNIPDGSDFASSLSVKGRSVITVASPDDKKEVITENGYSAVPWNRASALSARSLILNCLNVSNHLDEVVLFFDEPQAAIDFNRTSATETARIIDELVLGYQYLLAEAVARFEQKKLRNEEIGMGKLVFLYKVNPSESDAALNPNVRATTTLSSPLVAAAAAAFKAFAENTAALYTESDTVYPVLIICDSSMEVSHRDNTLASWLADYLNSIDDLKKRPAAKQLVSWIKAGAKKAGGWF